MVERDPISFATRFQSRLRLQGENVCEANCSDEGSSLERSRDP